MYVPRGGGLADADQLAQAFDLEPDSFTAQANLLPILIPALIDGRIWLRPCFVNFRTTEDDVLAILDVARELGERLAAGEAP